MKELDGGELELYRFLRLQLQNDSTIHHTTRRQKGAVVK